MKTRQRMEAWAWARLRERFGRDSDRSVSKQAAERDAVRRSVARVGQGGLEAFIRVTELESD